MNNYKLGSLFDGSGGFPLSGALCGVEPVWAAEVEPYPIAVTRSRFQNMKHLGDISKVNGADIEPVDIITFGSPCQDLSVAGKRAGLKHTENGDEETTRSGLFMEAVRIIKEMRKATNGKYPTFALWENVPGAFSSNNGEDFRIVCEELIKIVEPSASMPSVPQKGWNYSDCYIGDGWSLAYRVLDAQYWGVPQRRRRIYLVADFRGERAGEVLFEREGLRGYFTQGRTPWQTTPADAQGSTGADDREGEGLGADGGDGRGRGLDDVIAIDKESYTSGEGWDRAPGISVGGPCATLQTSGTPHAVCYEWHNQDSRISGPIDKSYTLNTNAGGREGHLVMEPFCKSARGKFKGDAETWKGAEVANTLNTFDQGEARANELVVEGKPVYCLQGSMIGRSDKNGPLGSGINTDVAFTQNATDRPAVAYEQNDPICVADHPTPKIDEKGTAFTLSARDYKNPQAVTYKPTYIVRRLTPTECARLQGFADWWGVVEQKDKLTEEEYLFWMEVRNTHARINGKKEQEYTEKQMLTWYNKLWTDSAEYKMWGNGIALPTALYCVQGVVDALTRADEEDLDDWMN